MSREQPSVDVSDLPDLRIVGVQLFDMQGTVWYDLAVMYRTRFASGGEGYAVRVCCSDPSRVKGGDRLWARRYKTQQGAIRAGLRALEAAGWHPR